MRNRKKTLEVTMEEMRNFSFAYIEKYAPSKQQLRTYLLNIRLQEFHYELKHGTNYTNLQLFQFGLLPVKDIHFVISRAE